MNTQAPHGSSIGPEHLQSLITYDHGVTWNKIKAPTKNNEGFNIHCTSNCSLHLSQKFAQLYPVTRSVSIMSSKSAPGMIMATGVIGASMKGHPALYVSRDAGLTWRQVLRDYYFFNMGDHGGVLVAVKVSNQLINILFFLKFSHYSFLFIHYYYSTLNLVERQRTSSTRSTKAKLGKHTSSRKRC